MKAVTKLTFLNDRNEKFFGEGPYRLLRAVEATGSLRAAALSMDMAYTKALKMLKAAENTLGIALTERSIGGKNGGGSQLTEECRVWLNKYEAYRDACIRANQALYRQYYPKIGCVIMASGVGKRFGGNKLMADFFGNPLICAALDATEGLFDRCVVVTRHEDVAELCRKRGIDVVLHNLPNRSDTVRLGLEALGDMDGCMFCPGDQPLLQRKTVAALIHKWDADRDFIWRASFEGTPHSPVLFPKWAFSELLNLPEGKGGGWVANQHPEQVRYMPLTENCELLDVDTPEDLVVLRDIRCREMKSGQE